MRTSPGGQVTTPVKTGKPVYRAPTRSRSWLNRVQDLETSARIGQPKRYA